MKPDFKISTLAIVIIGEFTPLRYHPSWLARMNLIPEEEANKAKIEMITQDFAVFEADWFKLAVTRENFSITCLKDDAIPLLKDLVKGIFHFFPQTPTRALGFNRVKHAQMESLEAWHAIGHKLVPKNNWGLLKQPGMMSVKLMGVRPDDRKGEINVSVEPSKAFQRGVYVLVNDHYNVGTLEAPNEAVKTIALMEEVWTASLDQAEKLIDNVFA